jgi:hypothetical protein
VKYFVFCLFILIAGASCKPAESPAVEASGEEAAGSLVEQAAETTVEPAEKEEPAGFTSSRLPVVIQAASGQGPADMPKESPADAVEFKGADFQEENHSDSITRTLFTDFEADESVPPFRVNSMASADVAVSADAKSGRRVLSIMNRPTIGAVILDCSGFDASEMTGVEFYIKGNGENALIDLCVTTKKPNGQDLFKDPNTRSKEDLKIDLKNTEWQRVVRSFKTYGLTQKMRSDLKEISFFVFDPVPAQKPILVDRISFIRDENDVSRIANHFTEAAPQETRLLFTTNDLPRLRQKVQSGLSKTVYEKMLGQVEKYMEFPQPYREYYQGPEGGKAAQGRVLTTHVLGLAFAGLMEENEAWIRRACEMIADAARDLGPEDVFAAGSIALQVGDMAFAFPIAYDWLNEYMTDEERLLVKNKTYEYAAWIFENKDHQPWGEDIKERHAHNWNMVMHVPMGMSGLLFDIPEWTASGRYQVEQYMQHCTDATGAPRESGGYLALGSHAAYTFTSAYEFMKGEDLVAPYRERLQQIGRAFAELMRPWGGSGVFLNQGAAWADKAGWFITLASKFQDPLWMWDFYRWYGDPQEWGGNGWYGVENNPMHAANAFEIILHLDESLAPKSPQELGLPLSHQFEKGLVTARDGWENDSAMLYFKSDESWGGWSHADDNTFGFFAYGDSIVCDPGHYFYYTEHHNGILIDGKGQAFKGPGHAVNGKITRFEDNGTHVIVTGDATEAYSTYITGDPGLPVDHAIRTVCFARGPNPYLVVLDDVQMQDGAEHTYAAHYHYGMRNNAAKIELNAAEQMVVSTGPRRSVKAKTGMLWPKNVAVKPIDPTKGNVTSAAFEVKAVNPHFVTLMLPVDAGQELSDVKVVSKGDWEKMGILISFPDGSQDRILLTSGDIVMWRKEPQTSVD